MNFLMYNKKMAKPESVFFSDIFAIQDFHDSGEYRETRFLVKQGRFSFIYQNSEIWVILPIKANLFGILSKKLNKLEEHEKAKKDDIILSFPYFKIELPESLQKTGLSKIIRLEPAPEQHRRHIINYKIDDIVLDPVFNFNSGFNFGLVDGNFKLLHSQKIGFSNLIDNNSIDSKIATPDSYVYCYSEKRFSLRKKSDKKSLEIEKYIPGNYWIMNVNSGVYVTKKPVMTLDPATKKITYMGMRLPVQWKLGMPVPYNFVHNSHLSASAFKLVPEPIISKPEILAPLGHSTRKPVGLAKLL